MITQKDVIVVIDDSEETIMFWEIPSIGDTVIVYNEEYVVKKVIHQSVSSYADRFTPVKIIVEKVQ